MLMLFNYIIKNLQNFMQIIGQVNRLYNKYIFRGYG